MLHTDKQYKFYFLVRTAIEMLLRYWFRMEKIH